MLRRLALLACLIAPATALAQYAPPPPPPPPPGYPPPPQYAPPPGAPPYEPPPPPPPPYAPVYAPRPRPVFVAPPPRLTGFQLAVRGSWAFPTGTVASASDLGNNIGQGDIFADQIAFTLDIGGRPIPQLFLGGYIGLGLGGVGQLVSAGCGDTLACSSATFRLGVEGIFHLLPGQRMDPWVGYGIGLEGSSVSESDNAGDSQQLSLSGIEWAHLMAGVDFRLTRVMSMGPFVDVSFGSYGSATSNDIDGTQTTLSIVNKATHGWVQLGLQLMIFP